ncbi:MAG: AMP-binding protein [bacterium]|nr:AMP-binding protein [bacterium]
MSDSDIIWRPSQDFIENSHIAQLMKKTGHADVREFLQWSWDAHEKFWETITEDLGMAWYKPYDKILDMGRGFPWAKWYIGGETNAVLNCIDRHLEGERRDQTALIWEGDGGEVRKFTYAELSAEVSRLANAMRAAGLKPGDRAGIFLPLVPEAAIAMYACFKIGVAMMPVFSGFGPEGLAERLDHAGARILFTGDGAVRRGKKVPIKATADEALRRGTQVEKVVVVRRSGEDVPMEAGRDIYWDDFTSGHSDQAETERLPGDAPSIILYTSGTTGMPKGCVYGHAGLLSGPGRDLRYAFDMREGDTMFWVTDFGWVMAPYELIGAHFNGHACMLYESVPNHPEPDRLWQVVSDHQISHLGVSPTAIRMLISAGDKWVEKHDLSCLRVLGSTGEPWDPKSYKWFFEKVGGGRCPIMNITGGTEIGGCLLQPLPVMALAPGTVGMPAMGTDCDIFDEEGNSISGSAGEVGYLVLKKPIPSLTQSFWKDDARYIETYFSKWGEGVWNHGDWTRVDAHGLWHLQGRADDTIKVAGKRVGPAEVEAELIKHPAVVESAVVGLPHDLKGQTLGCFVVLADGYEPSDALREELKDQTVDYLGKSFRPDIVKFVKALPKTRSAKIVRGAIKKVYLGEEVNLDPNSLENPENLEAIKEAI